MLLPAYLYELYVGLYAPSPTSRYQKRSWIFGKRSGLKIEYEYCLFRNIMSRLGGSDVRTLRTKFSTINLHWVSF